MVSRKFSVAILMIVLGPAAVVVGLGIESQDESSGKIGGPPRLRRSAQATRPVGFVSTPAPFERSGAMGVQGSPAKQSDQGFREVLSPAQDRVSLRLVRAATGEPLATTSFQIDNKRFQTDAAGRVEIERRCFFTISVDGFARTGVMVHGADFPPGDVAVHVRQHGSVATASVRVSRGLYVRGVVVGPDGEPLAGIMVERGCFGLAFPDSCAIHFAHPCLRSMKPSWRNALPDPIENRCFDGDLTEWASRTAWSGPDGTFALGPLDPGTYRVMALEKGVYRASEFVTARAGGARVTLHVPLGGLVEGCVVANGAGEDGLAGRVWAVRRGSTHATRAGFFIDPERNRCEFVLHGLEPGRYDLFALPGRFGYRETDSRETVAGRLDGLVVEGGTELRGLRVRLRPAGTICIHGNSPEPVGSDRSSIFTCRVMVGEATIAAALVSSSSRHEFVVPPGSYRIRLQRTVPPSTEHRVEIVTVGPGQDVAVFFP
jgi:hypothetical protein